jgi:hypothetical protein
MVPASAAAVAGIAKAAASAAGMAAAAAISPMVAVIAAHDTGSMIISASFRSLPTHYPESHWQD